MENFNSKLFFRNIEFLIRQQNKKIGEIEAAVGVSAGYISRRSKEGASKPSIEFVCNIAKELGVSLDALLQVKLTDLTPTEKYVKLFLEKVIDYTIAGRLDWKEETASRLNGLDKIIFKDDDDHPLFRLYEYEEETEEGFQTCEEYKFKSRAFGINTIIYDNCYELRLKNGSYLCIMNIGKERDDKAPVEETAIEAWMAMEHENPQFLCTSLEKSELSVTLLRLHFTVKEAMAHVIIDHNYRKIIDSFMSDDFEDDAPEPFDENIIPF